MASDSRQFSLEQSEAGKRLETRLRGLFLGALLLSVLALFNYVQLSRLEGVIAAVVRISFPPLLLWSFMLAAYAFFTLRGMVEWLRKAQEESETQVKEQTAELARANEELRAEVAQRKRAEEDMIRARREAEEAYKAKSEFLGNVSHEMRTPLTSMRNVLSNIFAGLLGVLEGTQRGYLEMLDDDCRRLCVFVDHLLDMARLDAGTILLEEIEVDLAWIAEQALRAFRDNAEQKGLVLKQEIPSTLPAVYADEGRILQVFTNLVENAIKFTPKGGTITIGGEQRGEKLCVAVADTGEGIAPENHERVFERFSQLDTRSGEEGPGTGLGLAICKQIIALHGGEIWVESEIGKGSTFYFSLPKAEPGVVLEELRR